MMPVSNTPLDKVGNNMCNGKLERSVCSSLTFVTSTAIAGLELRGPFDARRSRFEPVLEFKVP